MIGHNKVIALWVGRGRARTRLQQLCHQLCDSGYTGPSIVAFPRFSLQQCHVIEVVGLRLLMPLNSIYKRY